MKKFNDIFSIDSSTGGGKRLIKNIINKYRLGNEYKEIKENIENKGGSSNDAVYYKAIKENITTELKDFLITLDDMINVGVYCNEWSYEGSLWKWNTPIKVKVYSNRNTFGISIMPAKESMNGESIKINSIDDIFELLKKEEGIEEMKELFYQYFELSTKEEIEKMMDELINQ